MNTDLHQVRLPNKVTSAARGKLNRAFQQPRTKHSTSVITSHYYSFLTLCSCTTVINGAFSSVCLLGVISLSEEMQLMIVWQLQSHDDSQTINNQTFPSSAPVLISPPAWPLIQESSQSALKLQNYLRFDSSCELARRRVCWAVTFVSTAGLPPLVLFSMKMLSADFIYLIITKLRRPSVSGLSQSTISTTLCHQPHDNISTNQHSDYAPMMCCSPPEGPHLCISHHSFLCVVEEQC